MIGIHPSWLVVFSAMLAIGSTLFLVGSTWLKISIILSFIRQGLGLQFLPGPMLCGTLSLLLSFFIMSPVINETLSLYSKKSSEIDLRSAVKLEDVTNLVNLCSPLLVFYQAHSDPKILEMLSELDLSSTVRGKEEQINPLFVSVREILFGLSTFILTELQEACVVGVQLLLPFLVIDLIVANLLTALGMFMVSPQMISLPLKLLAFLAADGWRLVVQFAFTSYQMKG